MAPQNDQNESQKVEINDALKSIFRVVVTLQDEVFSTKKELVEMCTLFLEQQQQRQVIIQLQKQIIEQLQQQSDDEREEQQEVLTNMIPTPTAASKTTGKIEKCVRKPHVLEVVKGMCKEEGAEDSIRADLEIPERILVTPDNFERSSSSNNNSAYTKDPFIIIQ